MNINEIRPFIPCKNYDQSKLFYESLGFVSEGAGAELTIFEKDGCTFFLQRHYYSEEFAKNLMFQLVVEDIKNAHELASGIDVVGIEYSEIKHEGWGKVFYLWGPSGELWHITELNS